MRTVCLILLFISIESAIASWFHSNKIYSRQEFSYGLEKQGTIYFLSNFHRYRKPKWIARFPDGGQVKTVSNELALFKYEIRSKKVTKISILTTKIEIGTNIKEAKLLLKDNSLMIAYRCNNEVNSSNQNQCLYQFNFSKNHGSFLNESLVTEQLKRLFYNYWNKYRKEVISISKLKRNYFVSIKKKDWGFNP